MRFFYIILIFCTLIFGGLTIFSSPVFAVQVPKTIGYSGFLSDSSSNALSGSYSFQVKLYDTLSGGSALFSETHSSITVANGYFSLTIGTSTALSLPFDRQYYLGLNVNSTGEMSPRVTINSVGYSIVSDKTYGIYATSTTPATSSATGGQVYYNTGDNNLYVFNSSTAAWALLTSSTTLSNTLFKGGNSFGSTLTLGTTDSYGLSFFTNNSTRFTVASTGTIDFLANSLLNLGASGTNFSSSGLIVGGTLMVSGTSTLATSTLSVATATNLFATTLNATNATSTNLGATNATVSGTLQSNILVVTGAQTGSSLTLSGNLIANSNTYLTNATASVLAVNSFTASSSATLGNVSTTGGLTVAGNTNLQSLIST
ncbi:MAG: hypothetical protein FJY91_03110, partial [Candidatus Harrisonbacteria bacterium]|nr:hypothetical protein [Candidatus Harrisonbacteria bacterium]